MDARRASATRCRSSATPTTSPAASCSSASCSRAAATRVFDGEVVGLIGAGAFVAFGDGYEGLLPVRRLRGDWWELNEQGTILIGDATGARCASATRCAVAVRQVDAPRGRVDLDLVGIPSHRIGAMTAVADDVLAETQAFNAELERELAANPATHEMPIEVARRQRLEAEASSRRRRSCPIARAT